MNDKNFNFTTLTAEELLDGTKREYPFMFLLAADNSAITANSLTGICEGMIEGYGNFDESDQGDVWLDARVTALASFADIAQALVLAEAGPEVTASLSEEELTALLHPKLGLVLEFDDWGREDVPLILLATNYAPYNLDIAAPDGENVIWLNGIDERRFVDSLEKLGLGQLLVNESAREEFELDNELAEF